MHRSMSTLVPISTRPGTVLRQRPVPAIALSRNGSVCGTCNLRSTCLSGGVPAHELARAESAVYVRRLLRRGEHLFDAGDEFKSLYAIRSGFFKTTLPDHRGRDQVTGFFMGGELLGMDALGGERYPNSAIALEDSHVCVMPHARLEAIAREVPSLQYRLHSALAGEIVRSHGVMMLLSSMRGEERLATFLLDLSARLLRRGYSGSRFALRMSRDEIGRYLGLTLETVSRLFSKFSQRELIEVRKKEVGILDRRGLEQMLNHADRSRAPHPGVATRAPVRMLEASVRKSARVARHRDDVAGAARDDEQVPAEMIEAHPFVAREERDTYGVRQAPGKQPEQAPRRNALP
jgi:CRP/FNR family transcriptional regulator, anaerobic regulatory protein